MGEARWGRVPLFRAAFVSSISNAFPTLAT
jgi:hypothetical protein